MGALLSSRRLRSIDGQSIQHSDAWSHQPQKLPPGMPLGSPVPYRRNEIVGTTNNHRSDGVGMIAKKGLPHLGRWSPSLLHVFATAAVGRAALQRITAYQQMITNSPAVAGARDGRDRTVDIGKFAGSHS